jgi:hypothetical protein
MTRKVASSKGVETPYPAGQAFPKPRAVAGGKVGGGPGKILDWPDKGLASPSVKGLSPADLTGEDLAVLGLAAGRRARDASVAAGVKAPILDGDELKFIGKANSKSKVSG